MATDRHKFIVGAIARKVRQYGFTITYLDSDYKNISMNKPKVPPAIIHHKPDLVAEKESYFCIGEAKTVGDINNERTRNQFRDFTAIIEMNPASKLIIGIPLSGKQILENLLAELGLINHTQIEAIFIPDKLLPHEEEI